jgi:hypothetical protein
MQFREPGALRESPRQGMLACSGADDEHLHGGESTRRVCRPTVETPD